MLIEATEDDLPEFIWAQQAKQVRYDAIQRIGIVHETDLSCERLLFYDGGNDLRGIFKYFPKEIPGIAFAGEFVIIVDPTRRRQGVGMELLKAANARWKINFDMQRYTQPGAKLVNKFLGS